MGIVIEIEKATGAEADVMDLLQLRTVRDVGGMPMQPGPVVAVCSPPRSCGLRG